MAPVGHFDDPYLEWSRLTGFSGHAALVGGRALVPLLVEASSRQWRDVLDQRLLHVPAAYTRAPAFAGTRFFAGQAAVGDLLPLQALVTTMELGLPVASGLAGGQDPGPPEHGEGRRVIAVIDRGCALLNEAFGDGKGATRLRAVWDQSRAAHGAWGVPREFGYGRELQSADIDELLGQRGTRTEAELYQDLDLLIDRRGALRDHAHGTAVLDAAAGRPSVRRSSVKPPQADAASRAPLIFVELPGLAPGDTTGASPGAHLLDALHYIRRRAGRGTPVMVNLSLGALAGPHDGSSLVERAIDAFLEHDTHMQLFVAGGNAALDRWHARGTTTAGAPAVLHWRLLPGDVTDSFCELWLDRVGDDVAVELHAPDGIALTLRAGQTLAVRGQDPRPAAAMIRRGHEARSVVLLALGPTSGPRRAALSGTWRITLSAARPLSFSAWIQRDEPDVEIGPSPQSRFAWVSQPRVRCTGEGTLNSLATGRRVQVVGAANDEDGRRARYSSRGDGQGRDLDALAVADESWTVSGLMAAAVANGRHVRIGGSSMASPVYARWRFNQAETPASATASERPVRPGLTVFGFDGPRKPRRR